MMERTGDAWPQMSVRGRSSQYDDEATLGLMKELLEMNGYRVHAAGGGSEGLSIFERESPHVVITDIRMPGLDGLEVLRRVREIDDVAPVILVTGHGDLDDAVRAVRRGAYDFLQKPINTDILLNTVYQALEHYRLKTLERDHTRLLEEQVEERTRELARTNDFLRGILESSTGVSIVLTDFEQNVHFWNRGAERIFGYTTGEMVGSKITHLYVDDDLSRETVAKLRRMVKDKSGTVHGKMRQIAKNGKILTISLALSPMLDSSGEVTGILGLGQDVTEEMRLNDEVLSSYKRIQRIQSSSIFALARLTESRDGETGNHLRRIQDYCRALCGVLRGRPQYCEVMTDQFIDDLVQSSILHDIGKVAIPDSILFNTRKFGADEYAVMKGHAVHGGRALEKAANETGEDSFLSLGRDIAYYHHERWDGTGYPFQLKGEEIPLTARIVAIADVYDALTTLRRYKKAYSHDDAFEVVVGGRGKQFDPDLVDAFVEVADDFRRIREMDASAGHSGPSERSSDSDESADRTA